MISRDLFFPWKNVKKCKRTKKKKYGSIPPFRLFFCFLINSDLKDKMKELVKNHALRDKLANNSKVRRDAFFGWDEYAKKLEDLFEEIISGNI